MTRDEWISAKAQQVKDLGGVPREKRITDAAALAEAIAATRTRLILHWPAVLERVRDKSFTADHMREWNGAAYVLAGMALQLERELVDRGRCLVLEEFKPLPAFVGEDVGLPSWATNQIPAVNLDMPASFIDANERVRQSLRAQGHEVGVLPAVVIAAWPIVAVVGKWLLGAAVVLAVVKLLGTAVERTLNGTANYEAQMDAWLKSGGKTPPKPPDPPGGSSWMIPAAIAAALGLVLFTTQGDAA